MTTHTEKSVALLRIKVANLKHPLKDDILTGELTSADQRKPFTWTADSRGQNDANSERVRRSPRKIKTLMPLSSFAVIKANSPQPESVQGKRLTRVEILEEHINALGLNETDRCLVNEFLYTRPDVVGMIADDCRPVRLTLYGSAEHRYVMASIGRQ